MRKTPRIVLPVVEMMTLRSLRDPGSRGISSCAKLVRENIF